MPMEFSLLNTVYHYIGKEMQKYGYILVLEVNISIYVCLC